jgi:alpha-tubulin suppressor-like RCC1 family protein
VSGAVYVTGVNSYGQLGLSSTGKQKTFTRLRMPNNKAVVSISSGHQHTVAVCADGSTYSFGLGAQRARSPSSQRLRS